MAGCTALEGEIKCSKNGKSGSDGRVVDVGQQTKGLHPIEKDTLKCMLQMPDIRSGGFAAQPHFSLSSNPTALR